MTETGDQAQHEQTPLPPASTFGTEGILPWTRRAARLRSKHPQDSRGSCSEGERIRDETRVLVFITTAVLIVKTTAQTARHGTHNIPYNNNKHIEALTVAATIFLVPCSWASRILVLTVFSLSQESSPLYWLLYSRSRCWE